MQGRNEEERKKLDQDLAWVSEERNTGKDEPPSWWGSDEDAAASGLAMAQALGLRVPKPEGG